jgi:hypothetical protein
MDMDTVMGRGRDRDKEGTGTKKGQGQGRDRDRERDRDGGRRFMKKNQWQKISCYCSFKLLYRLNGSETEKLEAKLCKTKKV